MQQQHIKDERSSDPALDIITSLRWNSLLVNADNSIKPLDLPQLDGVPLSFHRDRLLSSAQAFKWQAVISVLSGTSGLTFLQAKLLDFSDTLPSKTSTYKLRLAISATREVSITAAPPISSSLFPFSIFSVPTPSPSGLLYLSPVPITPSTYTKHKTTNRTSYTAIMAHLPSSTASLPPTTAEILLYNPSGEITECVYSTPYFHRNGELITPSDSCGGNLGVTRRIALEKGWCKPGIILKESVRDGEVVWVSNAVRGFWRATVVLELPAT